MLASLGIFFVLVLDCFLPSTIAALIIGLLGLFWVLRYADPVASHILI